MTKALWRASLCLCLAAVVFAVMPAVAQPTIPSAPKSPWLITIQALVGSAPAAQTTATPTATNNDQPASDETAEQPQDTVGTEALTKLVAAFEVMHVEAQSFVSDIDALTEISAWLQRQSDNPRYAAYWKSIAYDLINIVAIAFLAAALMELILFPVRQRLRRKKPSQFSGRFAVGASILSLRFVSIMLFIGVSLTLLDRNDDPRVVRFVVLSVVYSIAVCRLVIMAARVMFAPRLAPLRLVPATAAQATSAYRWVCAYSIIIAFGYFFVDVAYDVHVPEAAITAFGNLLGFVLVVMTVALIMQKRMYVSILLRGNLIFSQRGLSLWQSLRLWFARRWHILAILYLVIGYIITAFGIQNGFALMLRGTILTLVILLLMRMLFHAVNRWGAADAADGFHHAALRLLFRIVIWGVAGVAAAAGWGANIPALFATPIGQRLMNAGFSITITVVIGTLVYETFSALIERHLNRRGADGSAVTASARARTLLPMIRNTAFIVFTAVVGLVVLSAVGVNIAPLLAGAGVLGVAIGFGSQTLVRDFITGLFIVLENIVAVGDYVKIGEFSGIVETISVRTIRLRDENGALHVLPFSEVSKISNMMRDFSFALIDVGVAYDTDLEKAMDIIKVVGQELLDDQHSGHLILEPVEVLGVENLGDFSITLRSRIRTRPGMQREVRRMFLLKLKQRFDKHGIKIPYPTVNYIRAAEERQAPT